MITLRELTNQVQQAPLGAGNYEVLCEDDAGIWHPIKQVKVVSPGERVVVLVQGITDNVRDWMARGGMEKVLDSGGTYTNVSQGRDWTVKEDNGDLEVIVNKDKNRLVYEETEHSVTIRVIPKQVRVGQ